MRRPLLPVLALALLLSSACGGEDSAGGSGETTLTTATTVPTAATVATTTTTAAPALPAGCELPPFRMELRLDGDGPAEPFDVVDAVAYRTAEGRAYTVYLTNIEVDHGDTSFGWVSDPPAGTIIIATGLTVFNAEDPDSLPILEGGEVGQIEWNPGELATFINITAEDIAGFSVDMTGSAELLYVDDTTVCFSTEIRSESGLELIGTYAAEIVRDY